jgi:nicotinamide-nucleotide amidase
LSSGSSPPFEAPTAAALAAAALAAAALAACRAARTMVATAESCTGGMIAAALTDIAGASDVVERGFVTYSNAAKTELLGVPAALIETHGAVSAEVAAAMAEGALARSAAGLALAVTGIAGPSGATPAKPVGLVYFGLTRRGGKTATERHVFAGDRAAIRAAATRRGLALIAEATCRP